jgi:hypothetical protein
VPRSVAIDSTATTSARRASDGSAMAPQDIERQCALFCSVRTWRGLGGGWSHRTSIPAVLRMMEGLTQTVF